MTSLRALSDNNFKIDVQKGSMSSYYILKEINIFLMTFFFLLFFQKFPAARAMISPMMFLPAQALGEILTVASYD